VTREITRRIDVMRREEEDSLTELQKAVVAHQVSAQRLSETAEAVSRVARTKSITPHRMEKP